MLDKPVVIITGASRGLGRAIAENFANNGYAIGINYHLSDDKAQEFEKELAERDVPAKLLKADVRKSDEVDAMIKMVEAEWGRIDVLVNNAGISRDKIIVKMSNDEWNDVLLANLTGPFYCIRAVVPLMKEAKRGSIINMASYLVSKPTTGAANYAASKAGLVSLTKSAAIELGRHNIRVNAIMPGFHVTDMNEGVWERFEDSIRKQHILTKLPEAHELGRFVYFVSTLDSVTGQVFPFESRLN